MRLIVSSAAMSGFDNPRASSTSTSTSRRVSPAGRTDSARDAVAGCPQHRVDGRRIQPPGPDLVAHRGDGDVGIKRWAMGTSLTEGVVDVGGGQDPCRGRERIPRKSVRVAAAVEPLVVLGGAGDDRLQRRDPREHALGQVRVGTGPFALHQRPRLRRVPHSAGHADHPDVVDGTASAKVRGVVLGHPHDSGRFGGQFGDASRMPETERGLEVGEVAQRIERGVELGSVSCLTQPRVEFDDLIPGLERAEPVEDRRRIAAQNRSTSSGSNWVPRRLVATSQGGPAPPV